MAQLNYILVIMVLSNSDLVIMVLSNSDYLVLLFTTYYAVIVIQYL